MFFDRFIRNIFIFLIVFVVAINIYFWSVAVQFGTQDTFQYNGFYTFFHNFEKMPKFEYFIDSLREFNKLFNDFTGWRATLAGISLGLSVIVEFFIYLTKSSVMILVDLFRIIFWILGFIGVNQESSPILEQ